MRIRRGDGNTLMAWSGSGSGVLLATRHGVPGGSGDAVIDFLIHADGGGGRHVWGYERARSRSGGRISPTRWRISDADGRVGMAMCGEAPKWVDYSGRSMGPGVASLTIRVTSSGMQHAFMGCFAESVWPNC